MADYRSLENHSSIIWYVAKLAGLEKMPVFVKEMTDDEATIVMVDANIQREEILPSERAFAFKMKMEAMENKGHHVLYSDSTKGHDVPKLRKKGGNKNADLIGTEFGITGRQVKRYILSVRTGKTFFSSVTESYM